ncbi:hypothetical protein GCK32_009548, partial [Trichostrongylus colubriformis]
MSLTFVFQLILFGPVLAVAAGYEAPYRTDYNDDGTWRKKLNTCLETVVRVHCDIVSNKIIAVLILFALLVYWYFAISGVINMKSRLDAAKILPLDSPLHRSYSLLQDYVWDEHFTPKFYVDAPFDITDVTITNQFWDMLKELESIHNCRGPAYSYVWLRDFVQNVNNTEEIYPYGADINPQQLIPFIEQSRHHYDIAVKWTNVSGDIIVNSFQFMVVYSKVTDWDIRISLLTEWRNIIDSSRRRNDAVSDRFTYSAVNDNRLRYFYAECMQCFDSQRIDCFYQHWCDRLHVAIFVRPRSDFNGLSTYDNRNERRLHSSYSLSLSGWFHMKIR